MKHTTSPSLKTGWTSTNPETSTKRTESRVESVWVAKERLTRTWSAFYHDPEKVETIEKGEVVFGDSIGGMIRIFDRWGEEISSPIPLDKVERKHYITVRETLVSRWEIVEEKN